MRPRAPTATASKTNLFVINLLSNVTIAQYPRHIYFISQAIIEFKDYFFINISRIGPFSDVADIGVGAVTDCSSSCPIATSCNLQVAVDVSFNSLSAIAHSKYFNILNMK